MLHYFMPVFLKIHVFCDRDIVLASHLKPLDKDERVEALTGRHMNKWNACADKNIAKEPDKKQAQIILVCINKAQSQLIGLIGLLH